MAPKVEAAGVDLFCEFPAARALVEDGRVVGVRTATAASPSDGPEGQLRAGRRHPPGSVVLGEGPRGTLVKQLEPSSTSTEGKNPQLYSIGLKEVWELPPGGCAPGR
jgi:electron-transferring-flavoprotein dehydrogenase